MSKESTLKALENYYIKQMGASKLTSRKNAKPEKLVEKDVLAWCRNVGWFINVVESKAVFSAKSGIYHHGQTVHGTPDLIGCSNTGIFVAIELKAKGRLSTLRDAQRKYICEVISRGGFACVVDSADRIKEIYNEFIYSENKKATLLKWLPKEKQADNSPLFED